MPPLRLELRLIYRIVANLSDRLLGRFQIIRCAQRWYLPSVLASEFDQRGVFRFRKFCFKTLFNCGFKDQSTLSRVIAS